MSVNLTVVYASVSYSVIKKTDLSGLLVGAHTVCVCVHIFQMLSVYTYLSRRIRTRAPHLDGQISRQYSLTLLHGRQTHIPSYTFHIVFYTSALRCFPVVIVVGLFGVVAGSTNILQNTDMCSCWCAPVLSNVMPYATHTQEVCFKL